jgi:hypothetical protein
MERPSLLLPHGCAPGTHIAVLLVLCSRLWALSLQAALSLQFACIFASFCPLPSERCRRRDTCL